MQADRIVELLDPFLASDQRLTTDDAVRISTYIDLLLRWNARINLTGIRGPEEIVTRHFGESLFAARLLFPNGRLSEVDNEMPGNSVNRKGTTPIRAEEARSEKPLSEVDKKMRGDIANRKGRPSIRAEEPTTGNELSEVDEEMCGDIANGKGTTSSRAVTAPQTIGALAPEGDCLKPHDAAKEDAPKAPVRLADLGSGAGFPGIPIKLWAPQISVTLIESNHKKAAFLREVTRALILTDIDIQNTRAESLPSGRFDVVTLRAVERFADILPTAAVLVAPQGRLALLIGKAQHTQTLSALPDWFWSAPIPIPLSNALILLTGSRR